MKLFQKDAVEWLKTLPSGSVDLLITDPPYESLEKHRKIGTTTRLKVSKSSSNEWFEIFPNDRFENLLTEIYRILKKNSHFYIFCDQETMFYLKPVAERVGFKFWKPIVWDKMAIGMGYHYRARYEFILFFEKGKRKLNNLGIPDILTEKRIRNGYPTEKPVKIIDILITQSSNEGDVIVDPFFGSGSTLISAKNLGRNAIGCDISSAAHDYIANRLKEANKSTISS
jgi:site-specific DNA-methyltransferase (adenine-specific)